MKVLTLDKLSTKGTRKLLLNGKHYDVLPMSVGNFVETTLAAERMVERGDTSITAELQEAIAMIRRSVPDAPLEDLQGMELHQLKLIVEFVKGDDVAGVEVSEAGEDPKN